MACIAVGINVVVYDGMLLEQPTKVVPQAKIHFVEVSTSSFGFVASLYFVGFIPFLFGFISIWYGTAILLCRHSKVLGRLKHWTMISLPLAIYIDVIFPTLASMSSPRRARKHP